MGWDRWERNLLAFSGAAHFLLESRSVSVHRPVFVSVFITLSVSNRFTQSNEAIRPTWRKKSLHMADVQGHYLWIKMETMWVYSLCVCVCVWHLKYPRGSEAAFQGQADQCFHSPSLCPQTFRLMNKTADVSLLSVYCFPSWTKLNNRKG